MSSTTSFKTAVVVVRNARCTRRHPPNPQRLLRASNNNNSNNRPLLFRQPPHRHYTPAAVSAVTTTTTTSSYQQYEQAQHNGSSSHHWFGATSAAAAAMAGVVGFLGLYDAPPTVAKCEEETPETEAAKTENTVDEDDDEDEDLKWVIGPDDPYYNVPDQDEPTDCQMCKTFRQGPCRLDWKRFELCVEDRGPPKGDTEDGFTEETDTAASSSSSEGSVACTKYAMRFYNCSHKHVNSYLILGNEQTQETVMAPLMDTYDADEAQSRRLCWAGPAASSPAVNWANWEGFVSTLHELGGAVPTKFALEQTGFASAAEALKATWDDKDGNRYLMMTDEGVPYLISVQADIPNQHNTSSGGDDDDVKLMMTFALDQNGNMIGDARNKDFDEAEKEEDGESSPPFLNNASSAEEEASSTTVDLQIQLVPGVTESFTVYGLYVPKDGDLLDDGILLESKPYSVERMTKKIIKRAEKKMAKQASSNMAVSTTAEQVEAKK